MKTKFAMLLALAALVVGGNARAEVVAFSTTDTASAGTPQSLTEASGNFLSVGFTSNGSGANNFTSIKFTDLDASASFIFNAVLYKGASAVASSNDLTYSAANTPIIFGGTLASYNWGSTADNYTLRFDATQTVTLQADYLRSNDGLVDNNLSSYATSAFQFSDNVPEGVAFTLYSSVPEPGTMILTGTALAAGAVGAYFKRRRKAKAEVAA